MTAAIRGNEVLERQRWDYGTVPRTALAVAVKDRAPSAAPELRC